MLLSIIASLAIISTAEGFKPVKLEPLKADRNGADLLASAITKDGEVDIPLEVNLDSGWYKFNFSGAGAHSNTTFVFRTNYYAQISITDAWCPGDAFDMLRNDAYLVTTPRVNVWDDCRSPDSSFTTDPDEAFWNTIWSSSRFMLPGPFNISIRVLDAPFGAGAGYLRADTRLMTCDSAIDPYVVVDEPWIPEFQAESTCNRIGMTKVHVRPENAMDVAQSILNCNGQYAWVGQISLAPIVKAKLDFGCIAFDAATDMYDPTVIIVDCNMMLPVVCMINEPYPMGGKKAALTA